MDTVAHSRLVSAFHGPICAGMVTSVALYGLTCLQTFYCLRTFKHDKWHIPALVVILWCLDTAHEVLVCVLTWYFLQISPNTTAIVAEIMIIRTMIRLYASVLFLLSLITALVNAFLLWRLWKLSRNIIYISFIGVLCIVCFGISMAFVGHLYALPSLTDGLSDDLRLSFPLYAESLAGLAINCAIGLLLAVGLVYYLQQNRRQNGGGFRSSDGIITRLIIMTVSTGVLTLTFVLGELVTIIYAPSNAIGLFFFFAFIVGKLYINSLLTSLNSRERLRARFIGQAQPADFVKSCFVQARSGLDVTIEIHRLEMAETGCTHATSKACEEANNSDIASNASR